MRKKQAWRYYCDFCNKGGCSGGHMKAHERSCCRNPARVCGMCETAKVIQAEMPDLIAALGDGKPDGVSKLREGAQGCPACMLAAIIQSKLQRPDDPETGGGFHIEFDFKKEKDSFWRELNSQRAEVY